jgi:hypothetical protein
MTPELWYVVIPAATVVVTAAVKAAPAAVRHWGNTRVRRDLIKAVFDGTDAEQRGDLLDRIPVQAVTLEEGLPTPDKGLPLNPELGPAGQDRGTVDGQPDGSRAAG